MVVEIQYQNDKKICFEGEFSLRGRVQMSVDGPIFRQEGDHIICRIERGTIESEDGAVSLEPGDYLITAEGIYKKL